MQSKRSFFNRTLFGKHLSRFWPMWGGVSLVGAMLPLYMQLALMQRALGYLGRSGQFREALYQAVTGLVPAFTCFYAILCVMAVWGYLYNARSVGLMHTLPVDRTCLFVTNTLAALAMILIPFAIVGGLICLVALGWGFFDLAAVANTVLAVLFCALLFAGMATLCAMLTGHGFVLPVFYLLANFLAFTMELLITNLAHEFLLGVPMSEGLGRLTFLSPVVKIYQKFHVNVVWENGEITACSLQGLWVVALYALAGCAMLALSWFLYKLRHSESAGDVVAFRWLRPVFRYGVALLSGLTVGRLLYELLWFSIFQRSDYADILPMAVCIFLGAVVGYYAASMLLAKSRRVFGKKSLPGVGIVAAGTAALCLLVSVDVFGLERKIPAWDDIESVSISDRGIYSEWSAADDPEQAAALRAFHQAVVDDRNYIRSYFPYYDYEEGQAFFHYIYLTYQMKDGSTLQREYNLWLTEDRVGTAGTYENLLSAFYQDPEVRASDVRIPDGAELTDISVCGDYVSGWYINTSDREDGGSQDARQIYAAMQQDAQEGRIPAKDVLHYEIWGGGDDFYLQLNYVNARAGSGGYYGGSKVVYLTPSMTNTIHALVELEYVAADEAARWEQDVDSAQAEGWTE